MIKRTPNTEKIEILEKVDEITSFQIACMHRNIKSLARACLMVSALNGIPNSAKMSRLSTSK